MLTSAHAPTRAVKLLLLLLLNLFIFIHNLRADTLVYKAILAIKNYEAAQAAYIAYLETALYAFTIANAALVIVSAYLLFGDQQLSQWIISIKNKFKRK
jgi:hypothetical protein